MECAGSLAARSRGCGLHVSWWSLRVTNSACVICRRRFGISMRTTNELRQVPDKPINISMECHGNRVRTGGYLSSSIQMQARRARAVPCFLTGSSRIHPIAQIPRTRVPIQRHRHLNERRQRPSTRKPSVPTATVIPRKKEEDSTEEYKQAKNLFFLREEVMAESSKTPSAMTAHAKVDDDGLVMNGQTLTAS